MSEYELKRTGKDCKLCGKLVYNDLGYVQIAIKFLLDG